LRWGKNKIPENIPGILLFFGVFFKLLAGEAFFQQAEEEKGAGGKDERPKELGEVENHHRVEGDKEEVAAVKNLRDEALVVFFGRDKARDESAGKNRGHQNQEADQIFQPARHPFKISRVHVILRRDLFKELCF